MLLMPDATQLRRLDLGSRPNRGSTCSVYAYVTELSGRSSISAKETYKTYINGDYSVDSIAQWLEHAIAV